MVSWYDSFLQTENGRDCLAEFDRTLPEFVYAACEGRYLFSECESLWYNDYKGQIMKTVMPKLKGKADGKDISAVVAELCK